MIHFVSWPTLLFLCVYPHGASCLPTGPSKNFVDSQTRRILPDSPLLLRNLSRRLGDESCSNWECVAENTLWSCKVHTLAEKADSRAAS